MSNLTIKILAVLGFGVFVSACENDKDKGPKGMRTTAIGLGTSLKADSPYAKLLPFYFSCGSQDATIASSCPANNIPFLGERGGDVTRDLIREHSVVSSASDKEAMNAFIDSLPDEVLPLFTKVKFMTTNISSFTDPDKAAAYGVIELPFLIGGCENEQSACFKNQTIPAPHPMLSALVQNGEPAGTRFEFVNFSSLAVGLCGLADAYAGQDIASLQRGMQADGKIQFSRFSATEAYSYTKNEQLSEFWEAVKSTGAARLAFDQTKLAQGMLDITSSAHNTYQGYTSARNDFIITCHDYLLWKHKDLSRAIVIADINSGKVFTSRKNALGDGALNQKLESMLPVIFQDPSEDQSLLETFPASSELSEDEIERLLSAYTFR